MREITRVLKAFWRDDAAATSIEYAMIACLIAVAIVATVSRLGTNLNTNYYQKVANNLT